MASENSSTACRTAFHSVQQIRGKDGVATPVSTAVRNYLVCLAGGEHLTRVALQHIFEETHASSWNGGACERETAIASIHQKQHVLCGYEIGVTRQFVPTDESG